MPGVAHNYRQPPEDALYGDHDPHREHYKRHRKSSIVQELHKKERREKKQKAKEEAKNGNYPESWGGKMNDIGGHHENKHEHRKRDGHRHDHHHHKRDGHHHDHHLHKHGQKHGGHHHNHHHHHGHHKKKEKGKVHPGPDGPGDHPPTYDELKKELDEKKRKRNHENGGVKNPCLKWMFLKLDKQLGKAVDKLEKRNEIAMETRSTGNDELFSICCHVQ